MIYIPLPPTHEVVTVSAHLGEGNVIVQGMGAGGIDWWSLARRCCYSDSGGGGGHCAF